LYILKGELKLAYLNKEGVIMPGYFECIRAEKVFDSCLKKKCFDNIKVKLPDCIDPDCCDFDVKFQNGFIKCGTLKILESKTKKSIPDTCRRIKAVIVVNYTVVVTCNGKCYEIPGRPLEIPVDTVMYHPGTRSEFNFNIVVETKSELLDVFTQEDDCDPDCECGIKCAKLVIGVFIVLKVTGMVQLRVKVAEEVYCEPPRECEDFEEIGTCDMFEERDFPVDFYPEQPEYPEYPCDC